MREGSAAKLRRRLAGDLDAIVLMSLRKEQQRRYTSVEQFSDDICRHLEGLPVAATRGSWRYRVLAHVRDKELSDPTFEPFWAKVEELGAVVFIHPNSYPQPQRFSKHYFSNVIGNPLDTTMALHWLIFDGVLERYPNLKIIASHGGGYLPGYSGRIDHAWGARSDSRGSLPKPPSYYLKKFYLDTIVFTTHQLEAMRTEWITWSACSRRPA